MCVAGGGGTASLVGVPGGRLEATMSLGVG